MGPVAMDETYICRKAKNCHASLRAANRGVEGKWPVVGIRDRATGRVHAEAIGGTMSNDTETDGETRVRRHLPQVLAETPRPVRQGVCRTTQPA